MMRNKWLKKSRLPGVRATVCRESENGRRPPLFGAAKGVWLRRPIQIPGSAGVALEMMFRDVVIVEHSLKRVRAALGILLHLAVLGRCRSNTLLHRSAVGFHSRVRLSDSAICFGVIAAAMVVRNFNAPFRVRPVSWAAARVIHMCEATTSRGHCQVEGVRGTLSR